MTEICLEKKFSEHLVASAKSKKQTIEIFAEEGKKKQKPFWNIPSEAPRSFGGQHSEFFLDKRYGKSRQKIFDGNYHPATGRTIAFQGKNKHKGNLRHVVSTYNSNRRSEECSSMGKKLVLCKNSYKLATSRKIKTFFGSMGDTYKGSRNFRNSKGVQNTFSKKSNTEESSPETPHMGQEQADLQYKWR